MLLEYDVIKEYLGVPFKHGGRDRNGLDCWGLIKMIYVDHGISLLDIADYEKRWDIKGGNYFIDNYHKEWIAVDVPEDYDVALFLNEKGISCHAGIWIDGMILHAKRGAGVVYMPIDRVGLKHGGNYRIKGKHDFGQI